LERGESLDPAGRSEAPEVIAPALTAILLWAVAAANDPVDVRAQRLYASGKWAEAIDAWRSVTQVPASADYYAGMAFVRLGNFAEARVALESGRLKAPGDKRFPIELAGLAYKRQDFAAAEQYLHQALRLDPEDRYANDFLGTLYYLRENLEAALRYWNRIAKPRIEEVRVEPETKIRPALLDHAFAFAPASTLELRQLLATEAALNQLGIFSQHLFVLAPCDAAEASDLIVRLNEREGWGGTKWQGWISMLRGAAYATFYPEWYNLGGSAVNVATLARFDPNKLRLFAELTRPAGHNPNLRWRYFLDGRKENWDLTSSFHGSGAAPNDLGLQKVEAGTEIGGISGPDWGWSATASVAARRFFRTPAGTVFPNGVSLKDRAQVSRTLLRLPEKRLIVESSAFGEFGKLFAPGLGPYSRMGAAVATHWLPQPRGDRYELSTSVRAGKGFGSVPFDELFMLGLERDNDLPARAHIGTMAGKKGAAPLGREYFLWNSNFDRVIYDAGVFKIKLGPFLDSGRITDPAGAFGIDRWIWDTGAQLKVSVLRTLTVILSYGKDLQTGRNAFYAMTGRP
jgi:tetratricopeptide (TPR) repeat protein